MLKGRKKKGGGKKKGGKGDDDGEINADQLYDMLKAKVDALKSKIALEQERRDNADSKREEITEDQQTMSNDMDEDKEHTRTVVTQMTRTYKNMEEGLNRQIDENRETVTG